MVLSNFTRQTRALEELQQNQQDQAPRSPTKFRADGKMERSPQKGSYAAISVKQMPAKDSAKLSKGKDTKENTKPKKTKSATNLVGLLSRPKSSKNLSKLAEQEALAEKGKENRAPSSVQTSNPSPPPPIYAQFCSQVIATQQQSNQPSTFNLADPFSGPVASSGGSADLPGDGRALKPRPRSFQPHHGSRADELESPDKRGTRGRSRAREGADGKKSSTWARARSASRPAMFKAFSGLGQKSESSATVSSEPLIDPKDIDKHLEALLDRRNIPENQRYKMRHLTDTVKMEFIRQDWAEARASKAERPNTNDSDTSMDGVSTGGSERDATKSKHSRGRSLTLGKNSFKSSSSPTKKQKKESTLGRHFRTKSTESIASDKPDSSTSSLSNGILAKVTGQQVPGDFVSYLRKVQKPELVEVGKLHKLRLLLRNERVSWAEDFIRQGGMKEIVDLLHRIMDVEWREEHEDALLHENLLCLKALCTTALALQYLHSIQSTLFPALLHMIFDPEKKGPSEFTTRNIITSVLFTYIQSAPPAERVSRAQTVLSYLRDPEDKEEERPVSFVLEMRRDRPYRVWCKEVVSVTKEVFWIFLHNLNVVSLPAGDKSSEGTTTHPAAPGCPELSASATPQPQRRTPPSPLIDDNEQQQQHASYMARHFPRERAPVPAAPYVGGVEWDATNYLASHLDLLNAIVACTPTAAGRNRLRELARVSGWERCLGGSLRLCKEKFYPGVHEGLRTWVAAAAEDGWDVRDVRFGPPPEARGPPRKNNAAGGGGAGGGRKEKAEEPPRLEMPRLDFGLDDGVLGGGGKVSS
ncbi:GTPase-binding protein rid1 [Pleurostoma richardsiae]|uniref:GTPase-binding protein rid1 n=1 Tax=Pleurostoma richardsiae TaxID=41990 RepID=A0AA38RZK4_9PEZI|nr:GTPase-binding protein rid1 [Pleurostoma richardsiae]